MQMKEDVDKWKDKPHCLLILLFFIFFSITTRNTIWVIHEAWADGGGMQQSRKNKQKTLDIDN